MFSKSQVAAQLTVGWYAEPVQRLYAEGKSKVFPKSQVAAQLKVGWYAEPVQRLYAEGKSKVFPKSQVAAQLNVGWYKEPVQRLYANNGKSKLFLQSQVAAQLTVGWYTTSSIDMYSLDGRKINVLRGHIDAHKKVGWYEEPMARVYATGNRSKIVPLDEVSKYQAVGWYPLHKFMFVTNLSEIKKQFGPLIFLEYYPGTPQSGDIAKWIYRSGKNSKIWTEFIAFDKNDECIWVDLKVKDVFPYLKLYADETGRVSIDTVNAVLSDSGIYGGLFRENSGEYKYMFSIFASFDAARDRFGTYEKYTMDYDYLELLFDMDGYGYININGICGFNNLVL